jgi:nitrite reductase (NO-forming)
MTVSRRGASAAREREIATASIGLAAVFVLAALVSLLLPDAQRQGIWLPLHLLFAGGAATAIAGVMPFFSAALTSSAPAPAWLRLAALAGVAGGAALITLRIWPLGSTAVEAGPVGATGGVVYIVGLTATGAATLLPLRRALGSRRMVIAVAYGSAIVDVVIGATLATLLLLGWSPAITGWAWLKPAHAWLNLFGFVSLTIGGTLLHLLPTVAGARIALTRAAVVTLAGLVAGPPFAALGFALDARIVAVAGAALTLTGGVALAIHAVLVLRSRGHWTTDAGWHRFSTASFACAIGWFICGAVLAISPLLTATAMVTAWQVTPLLAPLAVGWAAQTLFSASSHLLPAVGPGSPKTHAWQRRILGLGAVARLVVLNAGVLSLTVAQLGGVDQLRVPGVLAVASAAVSWAALIGVALVASFRRTERTPAAHVRAT